MFTHTQELIQKLAKDTGVSTTRIQELVDDPNKGYKRYYIRRGKKQRQIEEPVTDLKAIQKVILKQLREQFSLHPACMCTKGRSIQMNASHHTQARYLLKVDIKGCYQSVSYNKLPLTSCLVGILQLCFCVDTQGHTFLPTGAPTSPFLCNLALRDIDYILQALAHEIGYSYTRYIDDITFSTRAEKRQWSLLDAIKIILNNTGFQINKNKTRWFTRDKDSLSVTGISVGKNIGLPRKEKRQLRAKLQQMAQLGKPIDRQTYGYLAFVHETDPKFHRYITQYYQELSSANI